MLRLLPQVVACLVLAMGPIAPYFHLAAVPHHYCMEHHAFEEDRGSGDDEDERRRRSPTDPGAPNHGHERCFIVDIAHHPVDRSMVLTVSLHDLPLQHAPKLTGQFPKLRDQEPIRLAPKTSPPA